jgi:hypothetical protein
MKTNPTTTWKWLASVLFALSLLPATAQTTILNEDFEGSFPSDNGWSVGDSNGSGTAAYWDDKDSAFGGEGTHGGSWKGYCAGVGFAGTATSPTYQNSMTAYMSKAINLAGYRSANLSCWYRIPSMEAGSFDKCRIYIDSVLIFERTVAVTAWTEKTQDLTPYVGGTHTLKFEFVSNSSGTAEGWYLDDIVVTGISTPPPPTVTVTSPTGGENWTAGTTHSITWSGTGSSANMAYYKIALSTDGGVTWPAAGTANDLTPDGLFTPSARSFSWTIGSALNTTQARIRVRALDSGGNILVDDASDANFTISQPVVLPTVTVTAPNGGENWTAGTTHSITWSGTGSSANMAYYKIALSTDGGVTWPAAGTANDLTPDGLFTPSARSFSWTIGSALNTTQARIRVRALDSGGNILVDDTSDANFTISSSATPDIRIEPLQLTIDSPTTPVSPALVQASAELATTSQAASSGVQVITKGTTVTWQEILQAPSMEQMDQEALDFLSPPSLPSGGDLPVPTNGVIVRFSPVPTPSDQNPTPTPPQPSAPSIALGFQGQTDTGTFPPDTMGAVGPNHVMTAVNNGIRIQNRSGGFISSSTLLQFWSSLGGLTDVFDPKVIYDPSSARFLIVTCAQRKSGASSLLFGISQTSDPTGSWNLYKLDGDAADQNWVDFPNIGVNNRWITLTANMFTMSDAFTGENVWAIDKSTALAGGAVTQTLFFRTDVGDTLVPCLTYSNTENTQYLINRWNSVSGSLRLFTITGTGSSPLFTATSLYPSAAAWNGNLPNAPQLGTTDLIHTGYDRVLNAVLRNGSLWCVQTVGLPASGTPNRTAAKWWQINPTTGAVLQTGVVDDGPNEFYYYYPSIAVNRLDEVLIGFSGSSTAGYAGAYYTYRSPNDSAGSMQAVSLLKAGENTYFKIDPKGRNRWGDYSATMVDPVDDSSFWTIQEYAASPANKWGTWWGLIHSQIPASGSFTIFNDGAGLLTVTSISGETSAPWISWTPSPPFTVSSGGTRSVTVSIDFSLAPTGQTTTRLLVVSDDPDESPYPGGVNVQVNNPTPAIAVTPASQDFGSVQVNTTADRSFTVQNTGGGTLSGSASVSSPFSIVSGSPYSLTANQSTAVTVRYSPTAAGSDNQNVSFTGGGGASRAVSGSAFLPTVAIPAITPNGGSFADSVQVTLACSTPSPTIRYTTDGSDPTSTSTAYSVPFTLTSSATVKAKAFKNGYNDSAIAAASFTVTPTVAMPTITPNGGSFADSVQVALACSTPSPTIRYTTDGSDPTGSSTAYSVPFTLTTSAPVKAKAFKSGYNDSAIAAATFTVTPSPQPLLNYARQGDSLVFWWSTAAVGFALEYTTVLPATSWTSNSVLPAIVGGNYTVTNPITGGDKFYRLKK